MGVCLFFAAYTSLQASGAISNSSTDASLPHVHFNDHGTMKINPENPTVVQQAMPFAGSLVLTAAIFVALPLTQWASESKFDSEPEKSTTVAVAIPIAPPMFEPLKEEEVVEENLELEAEMQMISLSQIDMALNAGMGGMSGSSLNISSFQFSDDSFDDLVFEVAELDEQPKPIIRIAPSYPSKLMRAGIQGRVLVIFIVDEQGNIRNARVAESQYPEFSESALAAVRSWKFQPGKKDGKPVKTRVRIPLSFSLRR